MYSKQVLHVAYIQSIDEHFTNNQEMTFNGFK